MLYRGVHCLCDDLEVAASASSGTSDVSAVAWAPPVVRGEERVAIARGESMSVFALRTVTSADADMSGSDAEGGTGMNVWPV